MHSNSCAVHLRAVATLAAASMLAVSACARVRPPPPELTAIVLPVSGGATAPFEDAVARRLAQIRTLRGRGVLRIDREGEPPFQCGFLLLADAASRVRVRGTRAIGPVLFELVADDQRYAVHIPTKRRTYAGLRGQADDAMVLTPGTLTDPLRLALIPGSVRHVEYGPDATVLVETVAPAPEGPWREAQRTEFSPETGHVTAVRRFGEDGSLVEALTFGAYRALPDLDADHAFPFHVEIARPRAGVTVRLTFREVAPNIPVPDGAFDPAPPAGFTVLPAAEIPAREWRRKAEAAPGS